MNKTQCLLYFLLFLSFHSFGQCWKTVEVGRGSSTFSSFDLYVDDNENIFNSSGLSLFYFEANEDVPFFYSTEILPGISPGTYSFFDFLDNSSLGYVSRAGQLFFTENSGNSWEFVSEESERILDIKFINRSQGWIVDLDGIKYSNDGGKTWTLQLEDVAVLDIGMLDECLGFVAKDSSLYYTNTGGEEWNMLNLSDTLIFPLFTKTAFVGEEKVLVSADNNLLSFSPEGDLIGTELTVNFSIADIQVLDEDTWFVLADDYIYKTFDAGNTWSPIEIPSNSPNSSIFQSIFFLDENNGWLGRRYLLGRTFDGGQTWEINPSIDLSTNQYGGSTLHFQNELKGWAADNHDNNLRIYSTEDGGLTWTVSLSSTAKQFSDINFSDDFNGIATGGELNPFGSEEYSIIYRTNNGGESWTEVYNDPDNFLRKIVYQDASRVWLVGRSGTVIYSEDSGINWEGIDLGTNSHLTSIYFTDSQIGWIVGEDASVYKTTNGGLDWESVSLSIPIDTDLSCVFFYNEDNGWILSGNNMYGDFQEQVNTPYILKTTDAGMTWTPTSAVLPDSILSNNNTDFFTIDIGADSVGYIGGDNGVILQTQDFGATWNQMGQIEDESANLYINEGVGTRISKIQIQNSNTTYASFRKVNLVTNGSRILKLTSSLPDCNIKSFYPKENQQELVPISPTFSWFASIDCTDGYKVNLGTTMNGVEVLNQYDVGDTTHFAMPFDLEYATTYHLQIVPYNDFGSPECTQSITFETGQNCRLPDSLNLVSFHEQTGGENWINPWDLNASMDEWYGVSLNKYGCVVSIDLDGSSASCPETRPGNNLTGKLPVELSNLSSLDYLSLGDNNLEGCFPEEYTVFCEIQTDFSGNNLAGYFSEFCIENIWVQTSETVVDTLCNGDSFFVGDLEFTSGTDSTIILPQANEFGCDSLVELNLLFQSSSESFLSETFCTGESYVFQDSTFTAAGIYEIVLVNGNQFGCDSIIFLDLEEIEIPAFEADAGMDIENCDLNIVLEADLPSNTTGEWTSTSPNLIFNDINNPFSSAQAEASGIYEVIWTVTPFSCLEGKQDTLKIEINERPEVSDDDFEFTSLPSSMLEIPIDVFANDIFTQNSTINLFETNNNIGVEIVERDGLVLIISPELEGAFQFQYEICHLDIEDCCSERATVTVNIRKYLPPNTITPNGDGLNDLLIFDELLNTPDLYPDNSLTIFNRWGNIVFFGKPYRNDWGGTNQGGQLLPQGTYYYVLRLDIGNGLIYKGDMTILK